LFFLSVPAGYWRFRASMSETSRGELGACLTTDIEFATYARPFRPRNTTHPTSRQPHHLNKFRKRCFVSGTCFASIQGRGATCFLSASPWRECKKLDCSFSSCYSASQRRTTTVFDITDHRLAPTCSTSACCRTSHLRT